MRRPDDRLRLVLLALALTLLAPALIFCQGADAGQPSSPQNGSSGVAPQNSTADDTQDENQLSVNPVTGLTSAQSSNYTPLTAGQRWELYFKSSYWSVGAYFGPAFSALVLDQASGQPKEWGGGFLGYGRRLASRLASGDVVQNTFQFPAAELLHEDVRYITSGEHGAKRRMRHAILYSLLTYNNQGHTTLNIANIGGYYAANAVSTMWLPGRRNVVAYTLVNGTESIGLSVPVNVLQEFWPEVDRKILHRD